MITDTIVELEGVNGEFFNLTTGDQGVYLAEDVEGAFYDPPVKVVIEEPGNYPGARYLNHRILKRDIIFGVQILADSKSGPKSWLSRDSEWRKAWAFNRPCKLYVTTPDSGTRYLWVSLFESPTVVMKTDPRGNTINLTLMSCIAYDPFWYEDDAVFPATTLTDTRYDYVDPPDTLPTETLQITVDASNGGLNPTDQYVFVKWTLPGSTEAPSAPYVPGIPWLGGPTSPQVTWTVPDYSFEDPALENRRVRMPGLIGGLRIREVQTVTITGTGGTFPVTFSGQTATIAYNASAATFTTSLESLPNIAPGDVVVTKHLTLKKWTVEFAGAYEGVDVPTMSVTTTGLTGSGLTAEVQTLATGDTLPGENVVVNTDLREEQVVAENESPVWARMNGVRFRQPIPPYTESRTFDVTVSGTIPGQVITLRIPRPWSRCWGME